MSSSINSNIISNGDLNNNSAARPREKIEIDPTYLGRSLAISEHDDDAQVRRKYRPFILDVKSSTDDWTNKLELSTVMKMAEEDLEKSGERLKVLVLFGSLRERFAATVLRTLTEILNTQQIIFSASRTGSFPNTFQTWLRCACVRSYGLASQGRCPACT